MTPYRWQAFTDDELRSIWEGIGTDDGIRVTPTEDHELALLREVEIVMRARKLPCPYYSGWITFDDGAWTS